jgi:hypothetical protein
MTVFLKCLTQDVPLSISSPYSDGLLLFESGLKDYVYSNSGGSDWEFASVVIKSGISWLGWSNYYHSLRAAYLKKLNQQKEFRFESFETDSQRKTSLWSHIDVAISLAKCGRYLPSEVALPNFLEGNFSSSEIFRYIQDETGVSPYSITQYFLKSYDSQRKITPYDTRFAKAVLHQLSDIGLVLDFEAAPYDLLIQDLSYSSSRAVLEYIGVPNQKSRLRNIQMLNNLCANDPNKIKDIYKNLGLCSNIYYLMPPKEFTWADFQSLRQQVRGIAVVVHDLVHTDMYKNYPVDFLNLTS